jgi:hypothetical protein
MMFHATSREAYVVDKRSRISGENPRSMKSRNVMSQEPSLLDSESPNSSRGWRKSPIITAVSGFLFSEGMDSRAVAGLVSRELGDKVIRVGFGSKAADLDCWVRADSLCLRSG